MQFFDFKPFKSYTNFVNNKTDEGNKTTLSEQTTPPVLPPKVDEPKTKKGLPKVYLYLVFAILFTVAGALGFWMYQKTTQKSSSPTTDTGENVLIAEDSISNIENEADTQDPSSILATDSLKNTVFYSDSNNIFAYDIESKKISQLTSFPKNESHSPAYDESGKQKPNISILDIRVIDENNLGFGKCEIIRSDYACSLNVLNLKTNTVSEKKRLGSDMLLLTSDWHDPDTFSYLVTEGMKWQLFLSTNNDLQTLEDITTEVYGRGGYIEDSQKIRFSPDGKHLLHISTSSPRNISDFNIHIYGVNTDQKHLIQQATQPEWLNDNEIVYRKYDKVGDGLYIYSLNNQAKKKIQGVDKDSYNPEVLRGENKTVIAYENPQNKQVWTHDVTTNNNTLIADMALSPIWLNPNKLIFYSVELCDDSVNCPAMQDYKVKNISVYDMSAKTIVSTIPEIYSLFSTATQHH